MNTEKALNEHFTATGLLPEGSTRADWYEGHAVPFVLFGVTLGRLPVLQREGPILLHDLHHMLTGCAPDWGGEVELAGWELASGGCGWHLFYWIDRLSLLVLGLATAPARLLRGFRAGWGNHNLYGMSPKGVLRLDTAALQRYVSG